MGMLHTLGGYGHLPAVGKGRELWTTACPEHEKKAKSTTNYNYT